MPEAQLIPAPQEGGPFRWIRKTFHKAGVDGFTQPPTQDPDMFEKLTNIMPVAQGVLQRRWGHELFFNPGFTATRLQMYVNENTNGRAVVASATGHMKGLGEDASSTLTIFTPTGNPRLVSSRGWAFFASGNSADLKKWDGATTVTNWGIAAPVTAPTVAVNVAAGNVTLTSSRTYTVVYKNSSTGHISDVGPFIASDPLTDGKFDLASIPVSADSQVDKKIILATSDGGGEDELFYVTELANAATTYTDNTAEADLLNANVYLETDQWGNEHGVSGNQPPPNGTLVIKHRGRIFMAQGAVLRFSKSLGEILTSTGTAAGRYEECWPGEYQLDPSTRNEQIRALFSDGEFLYIGTDRRIIRAAGEGPDYKTDVVFNECGVTNHDVVQLCFIEKMPVGVMWLTSESKVVLSDMNTMQDVGNPVQHILNTINRAALSACYGGYFAHNVYSFYLLAIPTGANTMADTILVYDLKMRQWYVWSLAQKVQALLFNVDQNGFPQTYFCGESKIYRWMESNTVDYDNTDTPQTVVATIRTGWLDFGNEPQVTKVLNELELLGNQMPATKITVESANTRADFTSPTTVVSGVYPTVGPFGDYKVQLAGKNSKGKYYRITLIVDSGVERDILEMLSVTAIPYHTT